jgi:hypothetical protein
MEIMTVGSSDDIFYFNSSQPIEPAHGRRGSSGAVMCQEAGAGVQETRGGLGAALGPGDRSWSLEARDGSRAAMW